MNHEIRRDIVGTLTDKAAGLNDKLPKVGTKRLDNIGHPIGNRQIL